MLASATTMYQCKDKWAVNALALMMEGEMMEHRVIFLKHMKPTMHSWQNVHCAHEANFTGSRKISICTSKRSVSATKTMTAVYRSFHDVHFAVVLSLGLICRKIQLTPFCN